MNASAKTRSTRKRKKVPSQERIKKRFKKHASKFRHGLIVQEKILSCTPATPCENAACHDCTRRFQKALVHASLSYTSRHFRNDEILFFSIVPTHDPKRNIPDTWLQRPIAARKEIEEALRKAGISYCIGALDFSHNVDDRKSVAPADRINPHLSVHFWGFALERELTSSVKSSLRDTFPIDTERSKRPIRVAKEWDGNVRAFYYMLKPDFFIRKSIDCDARTRSGETRKTQTARNRELTSELEVRLRSYIGRMKMQSRLLTIGVRPVFTGPMSSPTWLRFRREAPHALA